MLRILLNATLNMISKGNIRSQKNVVRLVPCLVSLYVMFNVAWQHTCRTGNGSPVQAVDA